MTTTVHDPVCHMDIDPATAAGTSEYNGQTYYFCSDDCKVNFDKGPARYLKKADTGGSLEAGATLRDVQWEKPNPAAAVPTGHRHDSAAPHGGHNHQ